MTKTTPLVLDAYMCHTDTSARSDRRGPQWGQKRPPKMDYVWDNRPRKMDRWSNLVVFGWERGWWGLHQKDFGLGLEIVFMDSYVNMCLCVFVWGYVNTGLSLYVSDALSLFFVCLLRPHMYFFVWVFGVSRSWHFKPTPFIPWGRQDLRHTHTQKDSRSGCHLFLLWVQSPAEQWDAIRSLQRGSRKPFAAG